MYKIVIIVTQTESLFTETRLSKLNAHNIIMRIGHIHIASDNCELNHIESSCALSQSIK